MNEQATKFRSTFISPYEQYAERVGQRFTVLGPVPGLNQDTGEVEPEMLYRIQFEDGFETEAWPEEVLIEDSDWLPFATLPADCSLTPEEETALQKAWANKDW